MLEILRRDVIDAKSAYYLYVSRSICLSACISLGLTDEFLRNLILEVLRVQPARCDVSQFIDFCRTLYTFQTDVHHQKLKTAHTASDICQTVIATC